MAFDPSDPNTIYVGTHQGAVDEGGNTIPSSRGLLTSRDGGRTWTQVIGEGPSEGKDIRAIAVDPSNTNTVIAATSFEIYISHDKGTSWQRLTVGNEDILRQVDKLQIDSTAKLIYVGTRTTGVWRGILDYSPGDPASVAIAGAFTPMQVFTGQQFAIDVSADNLGGQPGSLPVEVKIGNSSLPVQIASITGGKAKVLKFQTTLSENGSFPVMVNGKSFGNITAILSYQQSGNQSIENNITQTTQGASNETREITSGTLREAPSTQSSTENQRASNPLQSLLQFISKLLKSLFGS